MDIQWEEPPDYAKVIGSGQQPGKHVKFAVALREHPGRWAVLPDAGVKTAASAAGKAQNIKRGKVKGFTPAGAYETAVDDTTIYVRYVAPVEEPKRDQLPQQKRQTRQDDVEPSVGEVRAWARAQGMDVPERGRLSQEVFDKYAEAVERGENGLGMRIVRN